MAGKSLERLTTPIDYTVRKDRQVTWDETHVYAVIRNPLVLIYVHTVVILVLEPYDIVNISHRNTKAKISGDDERELVRQVTTVHY